MNMSVGSNIMKQINSKLGGVSVKLKLPEFMKKSKTMIVGIDVCHASKNSVVGFVASTDLNCSSFYTDIICQAKGQEIIKKDLDRVYTSALEEFNEKNGSYPDKIIIYRDGLSQEQRTLCINNEIKQLREVIDGKFGKDDAP